MEGKRSGNQKRKSRKEESSDEEEFCVSHESDEEIELIEISDDALEEIAQELADEEDEVKVKKEKKGKKKGSKERTPRKPRKKKEEEPHEYDLKEEHSIEKVWKPVQEDKPPLLDDNIDLLPFQKEGLAWLKQQETETEWKGGILADDMGMGKTLQAISLLVSRPPPEDYEGCRTTLIVCPVIALAQWKSEIEKFTKEGSLSIHLYHGTKRSAEVEDLTEYDIVITTYSIVETEYRQQTSGYLASKKKRDALKDQLEAELEEEAEEEETPTKKKRGSKSSKSPKSPKTPTKSPKSSKKTPKKSPSKSKSSKSPRNSKKSKKVESEDEESEEEEIEESEEEESESEEEVETPKKKTKEETELIMFSPPSKSSKSKSSTSTSRSTSKLKSPVSKAEIPDESPAKRKTGKQGEREKKARHAKEIELGIRIKKESLLHSVKWYRIILDEAHSIKDRASSTARSVFNMDSIYRWSLTGTPLQNRIGELNSLIRFLRIVPYSYYYCKRCPCRLDFWKFEKGHGCFGCGHSAMSHFSWWNRYIMNPIQKFGVGDPRGQEAMKILKSLLHRVMLRRTKEEKKADMCLPPRTIRIRYVELDEEENDFYEALYTQSKTKFEGFVDEGTVLSNYAHVFDLLLRLRQAVVHPYLVLHAKEEIPDAEKTEWCQICQEPAEDVTISKCKHVFCRFCIKNHMDTSPAGTLCPVCRKALTVNFDPENSSKGTSSAVKMKTVKNIMQRVDPSNWRSSSKIEAMMEELTKIREANPGAKVLIFSQFVNFLDLVEWRLKTGGFGTLKLDGRMSQVQKAHAINLFNTDENATIFLISLKAGGVALNLTVASHCFLTDPWWNPAAEFQAIDRVYRLGQYKCISVIRFICPNSIEERILQLQEKKHLLFNSTVGMDNESLTKLSVADLKFLFNN
eukprot:TRINITY_DN2886_c0_g1_i1.p1 TRINITY_DN2886_c0_g1~~TRINITY_DN2886_c0_g1_i1.p1  ORF type:complete len:912 (+),score=346.42 TRINITY_DN2886_c0_g1_i1:24-2759(+)